MEYESSNWNWDGRCFYPHLFGGIMLTAALVTLSANCLAGNGVPRFPFLCLRSGISKKKKNEKKRVRVFMDGCFDLMHYGHANALRQAKALGDELIVGVISDEEIASSKGPPVFSIEERLELVKGLKWVDGVVANIPYALTEQLMKTLLTEHKIDYIVHGDDPCILPDGTDAYALAKKTGCYKQIKRTEGVSSTDIVERILSAVKDTSASKENIGPAVHKDASAQHATKRSPVKVAHASNFLPTSRRIVQFSNGQRPAPNARVVYIDGAFDLFHAGHVEILKSAQKLGDFLLVGIYPDHIVSELRGTHYPLMNLHERTLSVLSCRYVDEVIIGAPWSITKDMIVTFNISLIVRGTVSEPNPFSCDKADPYAIPRSMGIFRMLESPRAITTSSVAQRIFANHDAYTNRNAKKVESEKRYYEEKKYVSGD